MLPQARKDKAKSIFIKVSDMKLSKQTDEMLCASNLGSDVGVSIFDPSNQLGGLMHAMLPESQLYPDMAQKNPYMFVDTGLLRMLEEAHTLGAAQNQLVACVAGGADFMGKKSGPFAVGARNISRALEILKKAGITVSQQSVGGCQTRSLYLNIGTGNGWIDTSAPEGDAC